MKTLVCRTLALCLLASGVTSAHAAQIVTDPVRVSGHLAINPPGALDQMALADGATDPQALMSATGFAAIQDFSALTGEARHGAIFRFSGGDAPDVRLSFVSNPANITGTAHLAHAQYSTSANSAFRVLAGAGRAVAVRIDFGRHDTSLGRFLPAARGSGVADAGFTLAGAGLRRVNEQGITVRYLDATGGLISSQTIIGDEALAVFTGTSIRAGQAPIAAIEIQFQFNADGAASIGLDDLGFSNLVTQR